MVDLESSDVSYSSETGYNVLNQKSCFDLISTKLLFSNVIGYAKLHVCLI